MREVASGCRGVSDGHPSVTRLTGTTWLTGTCRASQGWPALYGATRVPPRVEEQNAQRSFHGTQAAFPPQRGPHIRSQTTAGQESLVLVRLFTDCWLVAVSPAPGVTP